jgi:hypothetical protein
MYGGLNEWYSTRLGRRQTHRGYHLPQEEPVGVYHNKRVKCPCKDENQKREGKRKVEERESRLERSDVGKSTPPPLVQQNGTSRVQSGCFVVSVSWARSRSGWVDYVSRTISRSELYQEPCPTLEESKLPD